MNETYILFLDLDGCIVDFDKGYKKLSGGLKIRQVANNKGEAKARSVFIDAGSKFWEDLDWIDGGRELFNTASRLFKNVYILSSSGTTDESKAAIVEKGKRTWLKQHIPSIDADHIFIVRGRRLKEKYSAPNSILVDDMADTVQAWKESGGIGILHNYLDYHKTISELENLALNTGHIKLKELISSLKS